MLKVPDRLSTSVGGTPEGRAWLQALPATVEALCAAWSLEPAEPFAEEASCAWVAPCARADGSTAVLKVGFPHMEAADEIAGLKVWAGDPTVRLLDADLDRNAMLLERCEPGTHLRGLAEADQDEIIAMLLKRLWTATETASFRPLGEMIAHWCAAARDKADRWADSALAEVGLEQLDELVRTETEGRLLATDLHAGNVLRAQREPWLVVDPKPFVGDPAYDVTQHLLNCRERLAGNPLPTIRRVATLAGVDVERARLWTFARLAIDTDDSPRAQALARLLVNPPDRRRRGET